MKDGCMNMNKEVHKKHAISLLMPKGLSQAASFYRYLNLEKLSIYPHANRMKDFDSSQ
jgi:hypothetical protein